MHLLSSSSRRSLKEESKNIQVSVYIAAFLQAYLSSRKVLPPFSVMSFCTSCVEHLNSDSSRNCYPTPPQLCTQMTMHKFDHILSVHIQSCMWGCYVSTSYQVFECCILWLTVCRAECGDADRGRGHQECWQHTGWWSAWRQFPPQSCSSLPTSDSSSILLTMLYYIWHFVLFFMLHSRTSLT